MAFPPRQVVTISQDDHPALASHLEMALQEELQNHIQGLTSAKDWADYEKRRGTINGINAAIALCRNIQSKLQA